MPTVKKILNSFSQNFKEKNKDKKKDQLIETILENVDQEKITSLGDKDLNEVLKNADLVTIEKLANSYVNELSSNKNQNDLTRSVLVTAATSVETNFSNEQDGPLNIANIHDFTIMLTMGANVGPFMQQMEVIDRLSLIHI